MNHSNQSSSPSRRLILAFGGLLLLWPLIRFIAHKLPRKPKIIETTGTLQNDIFLSKQDFIVFTENTELWAVSRTCTHLGCRLNLIEEHNYLECPCHQSRFSIDGEVIKGPADKPLPRYLVERTDSPSTYLVTIT